MPKVKPYEKQRVRKKGKKSSDPRQQAHQQGMETSEVAHRRLQQDKRRTKPL